MKLLVPDPAHRNCDEPMFVERKDGSLWMLIRTRYGIGESLSTDGGKTFGGGLLLDERGWASYPDGFQASDGTIHVIYDHHRTTDRQILMAAFTVADVRAGKPTGEKVRLRVLVN